MCGIAGFIEKAQSSQILSKMNTALNHRGPDGAGVWCDTEEGIGLAHRRLSIIDLSDNGRQPMFSPSGRFVVVFNGEIYNYQELRKEIDQLSTVAWQSRSDTEVMLAAFEIWGIEKAVQRFVGMFAFALWDRKERTLYLCRDRLGIKPLYYSQIGATFMFGSELKALRSHPNFIPEIDRDTITLYLRHNCIPAPYCIYKNTFKLEPGKILKISANSIFSRHKLPSATTFWSAKEIAENSHDLSDGEADEKEWTNLLERRLKEAVSMRMISDVPLGVFLSGGVDSSTVAALMQAESAIPIKTFTIGFEEEGYDETDHARAVARHLGTEHNELCITADQAMDVITDLPTLYDEPFGDSSQIPTHLISKMTRQYVTVCLSGDGGDEIFGGYNRYRWMQKILDIQNILTRALSQKLSKKACNISPLAWDRLFGLITGFLPRKYRIDTAGEKLHKLANALSFFTPDDIYYCLISHWLEPEQIVIDTIEPATKVTARVDHPILNGYVQMMMYLDLVTYLPDDILTKVDRASMGVGLETRVPLLDHRVVELAWQIPLHMKIHDGQGKWILKKILYKYVPRKLIDRPKAGFAIPLDSWLREPLRDWAESLLDEKRIKTEGVFNPVPIRTKWNEHISGRRNNQAQLWDILMFQAWMERWA